MNKENRLKFLLIPNINPNIEKYKLLQLTGIYTVYTLYIKCSRHCATGI